IQHRQEGLDAKIDGCVFFVTCTQHSHDTLRELYGDKVTEKCHVVHHGINLDAFNYREPPADDGDRPFRLVCVATFEPCKGHHYLVEAVRILRDRGVDIELKLIGGDPPRKSTTQAEIRAQVREAGLEDRVQFLGKQSLAEVRAALEWADIGVLASHRTAKGDMDGLPNVLTESLGMGRPVVSTTLPGIMELVDDGVNGLLVRTRDAEAFADAIERLRNDPELRVTMGKAGAEKVIANEDVLERTSELIEIYMDRIGRPA
ncbi:MAG: glycosyltransferase family 4 protein, partial [Actinobacteria bacterium]|nr:glycosyltransferase family 4 protein [Actinomycetota bacterium]